MSETALDLPELERRMDSALIALRNALGGLRSGRADPSLLERIMVESYGGPALRLQQLGAISAPEPRLLTVQVWDRSTIKDVEQAIRESGLELNPQTEGQTIRIPLPELTKERRQQFLKVAAKHAEQARIAVRNLRRNGLERLKQLEKQSQLSQNDRKSSSDKVQTLTEHYVKTIDAILAAKENEIMQV